MQHPKPALLLLCSFLLLATHRTALGQERAIVCDSSLDAIYHFDDVDGDGVVDPDLEVTLFYDDSSTGPDLSTPNHLLEYGEGILLSDGGSLDAIFWMRDSNSDGDANDDGEIVVFYDDDAAGPSLSSPNGMVLRPDGSIFVCDDGAAVRAVLRLADLNSDGDAQDLDEGSIYFDASSLSSVAPVGDPESIALFADGRLLLGDTSDGRLITLEDIDGDGTAQGEAEATVYYQASNGPVLVDIDALQIDTTVDPNVVFAIDEDNGLVLRLEDANGDGDADDAGESRVWIDPSITPASDPNDAFLLEGPSGPQLFLADGATDAIWRASDTNGDGSIDATEITPYFDDASVLLSTPSGIVVFGGSLAPPAPTVTDIDPTRVSTEGGTLITVSGSEFDSVSEIQIDTVPVDFSLVSSSVIEFIAPARSTAGSVDLTLLGTGGTTTTVGAFDYLHPFRRGDADGSGALEITDVVRVLEYLYLGTVSDCLDALDSDDNDQIEVADAIAILAYLFQSGSPPSAPFPGAGLDPTPGDPGCESAP